MLMLALAISIQADPDHRLTDLFECRIPPDATAEQLAPVGLFLAGERIEYVEGYHRWEYLLEDPVNGEMQLFGAPAYGPFIRQTSRVSGDRAGAPHRSYSFEALVSESMTRLAETIEGSLLGIDCQPNGARGYSCRYPRSHDRPWLTFADYYPRQRWDPDEPAALRLTCRFTLADQDAPADDGNSGQAQGDDKAR